MGARLPGDRGGRPGPAREARRGPGAPRAGERAAGIEAVAGVNDAAVVRAIAKALRDRQDRVRIEAIEALGWSSDSGALKQLHRLFRRGKKLRDDEVVMTTDLSYSLLDFEGEPCLRADLAHRGDSEYNESVIASLHDVNLASRYADRCLLLYGDGSWELGSCDEILTESRLEALYGTPMEAVVWRNTRLFVTAGANVRDQN